MQVVYAPDGTRMYSGGSDGGLCVYDVAQVRALKGSQDMKHTGVLPCHSVCGTQAQGCLHPLLNKRWHK